VAAADEPAHPIRVLLLENVSNTALEVFGAAGLEVETMTQALAPDALAETLAGGAFDVLGIRSKTRVPEAVLAQASSLLAIGCFCIGTDQVELGAANRRGIPVFNAPFSNTRSVAELMIAEIISLSRQLGDRTREVAGGTWKKVAAGCYEVRGKTLGIVGYGHIGRQLGVLAEGLGMRVFFHDHTPKLPMGNNAAVPTLRELLALSDFVSLHVPDTQQTRNLIGAAELALMKRGSYLLNASRGTVVVIPALAAALQSGHLAGAAVDVYPEEPETSGEGFRTALQGLPNVLLTPHIGGSTSEAQAAIGREVSTVLTKFVLTGATRGAVNFPNVEPQGQQEARRILNVHRNVPGVLRDINKIVSDRQANIRSQVLATDPDIGYLIMDIDQDAGDISREVHQGIAALPTSIRTRIV
jgi:D-3-phosphoglycerate dehydrogenase / 2-oxoglutarate reductase